MIIEVKCLNCGCKILDERWRYRKFCTKSCSSLWRHKNKPFSLFVKGAKLRLGIKHTEEYKKNRMGAGNPAWKGDRVKYSSLHCWIRENLIKPDECEICSKTYRYNPLGNQKFNWSNKDHKYRRIKKEWQFLCRSCHMKYDYKLRKQIYV
jgi:hypothetical protein